MPSYKDKNGHWRYRIRVVLPDGTKKRLNGTPAVNSKVAADQAQEDHIKDALGLKPTPTTAAPRPWTSPMDFARWLQGFAELSPQPPTQEQWEQIRARLDAVVGTSPPEYLTRPQPKTPTKYKTLPDNGNQYRVEPTYIGRRRR